MSHAFQRSVREATDAVLEAQRAQRDASGTPMSVRDLISRQAWLERSEQLHRASQETLGRSELQQRLSSGLRIDTAADVGINLLDGTAGTSGTVTFQVGANDGDTMTASFVGVTAAIETGSGNAINFASDIISTTEQNLSASNSQIKDVKMASEMTNLTQQQILEQAGTAMLAQANQQPQMILKLLQ